MIPQLFSKACYKNGTKDERTWISYARHTIVTSRIPCPNLPIFNKPVILLPQGASTLSFPRPQVFLTAR